MSLGDFIKNKIIKKKADIQQDLANKKECVRCGIYTDKEELRINSEFPLYKHKEICDKCADVIEEQRPSW